MCDVASLVAPGHEWRYDDHERFAKLVAGIGRHGMLRPVVVRENEDGRLEVVEGRRRLRAAASLGLEQVPVVSVGRLSRLAAQRVAYDLGLEFDIDYAKLAAAVAAMVSGDDDPQTAPARLAATGPFSVDRVRGFVELVAFDWSQFDGTTDGQAGFQWDAAPGPDQPVAADPVGAVAEPALEPEPAPVPPPVDAQPARRRPADLQTSLF